MSTDTTSSSTSTHTQEQKVHLASSSSSSSSSSASPSSAANSHQHQHQHHHHQFHFITPVQKITKPEYIAVWKQSEGYAKLFGFVNYVNEAIKGLANSDSYPISDSSRKLTELLDKLSTWVDEIPPVQQPMRFGNKAFRTWMDRLEAVSSNIEKLEYWHFI